MPAIDSGLADWLRSEGLYTKADNGALAANILARALEQEVMSPYATKAGADMEAARQIAFLGGPLALDRHNVPGQRKDLIARPVRLNIDQLGYNDPASSNPELADPFLGAGWSVIGGATITTVGAYRRVADADAAQWGAAQRSVGSLAVDTYTAVARIKRDDVSPATRFVLIRLAAFGGVSKLGDLRLDTQSGAYTIGANVNEPNVKARGDDWLVWFNMVQNSDNTGLTLQIYPAVGANANLTSYAQAAQGSIDVRSATFFRGRPEFGASCFVIDVQELEGNRSSLLVLRKLS